MPTLSLVSIVLLAAWLGAALITSAVVAPAAFAVLPSRSLAGALVGRVLPVLFWSGALLGASTVYMGRRRAVILASGVVMMLACISAQAIISPRIEAVRIAIGGPVDALDATEPRRQLFGRLHGLSVLALGVAGIAAIVALTSGVRHAGNGTA